MLTSRLHRAQLELQAHRTWLRSFHTGGLQRIRPATREAFKAHCAYAPAFRNGYAVKVRKTISARNPALEYRGKFPGDGDEQDLGASLKAAVIRRDIDFASKLYNSAADKQTLDESIIDRLVFGLDKALRRERQSGNDTELIARLQALSQQLVKDICKGVVSAMSHSKAALITLSTDTEDWDTGLKLWKWAEAQGDEQLSPKMYSAAIELMAQRETPLAELEELYQQALAKCMGVFAPYHFSPGAVVPDREHDRQLPPLPFSLLEAIATARLFRGDPLNAYLALDALLRIRPNSLRPQLLKRFMEERPVSEAYHIFALACRAGVFVSMNQYRQLLALLRLDMDGHNAKQMIPSLRAMISSSYLFISGGGKITSNFVSEILIGLTSLMRTSESYTLPNEQKRERAQAVHRTIQQALETFARLGATPSITAFNSIIINIGGHGQSREAIDGALRGARALGLAPTIVTHRSVLTAAGKLQDTDLIKTSWTTLVESRAAMDQYPDATDLYVLIKSCTAADHRDMARAVINEMTHFEDFQRENAYETLESDASHAIFPVVRSDNTYDFADGLSQISADLTVLQEFIGEEAIQGVRDLSEKRLPTLLGPPLADVDLPESEMRAIYDAMTTDPTAAKPAPPPPGFDRPCSKTSIPFGRLRYENWKSLNYLLAEADRGDGAYNKAVDEAIANGTMPPRKNKRRAIEANDFSHVGLSDLHARQETEEKALDQADIEARKKRIMELRKRNNAEQGAPHGAAQGMADLLN